MGERKRRQAAGYVPPPQLTERQRIELSIPAALVAALAYANVFGGDDAEEVERQSKHLQGLVIAGLTEPFADLSGAHKRRLITATTDLCRSCIAEMGWENQPSVKFAMSYYYWIEDLLSRGVLELAEGSAMGEALTMLLPMMSHGFEHEARDASAQKQARKLLRWLQGRGFYAEAVNEREAA
jgi:hypothetical protein